MSDRRAFATEIEVSPDGRFAGNVVLQIDAPAGSKISLIGRVRAEGARVWIEIESNLVERKLRANAPVGDLGPDPRKNYRPRVV